MLAFVLSGGGNYGAMQAGALRILLEYGITPQMMVGTSAGALNSIFLATDLTIDGVEKLENLWLNAKPTEMGLTAVFELVGNIAYKKESLFSNKKLLDYLITNLPATITTFGDIRKTYDLYLYTTAVGVSSGKLKVFGDLESDTLIDGGMASSAIPPYYPPWSVNNSLYLDGGILCKLPIMVAIRRGASEIIALDIGDIQHHVNEGMFSMTTYAISLMSKQQTNFQLRWAKNRGVKVHHLVLKPDRIGFWDFSQAKILIEAGRQQAENYLKNTTLDIPSGISFKYRINKTIRSLFKMKP